MFCPNCGNQIEDGVKFCEHCGAQLEQKTATKSESEGNVDASNTAVHALPKKPGSGKAAAVAAAAVVLLAAGGFMYSKLSNTLNINKYITVTFEGYDGYGRAHVELNSDELYKDWGKKLKIKDKTMKKNCENALSQYGSSYSDYGIYGISGDVKDSLGYMVLMAGIENRYQLDQSSQLTNGDAVVLSWDVQDIYTANGEKSVEDILGIKLKADKKDFKVDGLEEVGTFDAFANVEVSFSGIAPHGEVSITDNNKMNLDIECSQKAGLSDGDTITLTISNNNMTKIVETCGGIPETLVKEYTVSGLNSYVQSIASISDDMMNQMIAQGENILRAKAASDWGNQKTLRSIAYQGCYLLKARYPEKVNTQNDIGLVYQMTANVTDNDFTQDITYFCYVAFEDLVNDGDGVTTVDMSDYDISRSQVKLSRGWWSWSFYGSQTLEDLKNEFVTANLDQYDSEESFAQ